MWATATHPQQSRAPAMEQVLRKFPVTLFCLHKGHAEKHLQLQVWVWGVLFFCYLTP